MARILVVDDHPHIVRLLRRELEEAGHEVAVAATGEEALQRVRQEAMDLVVLDVMLPAMTGLDVLRAMKSDPSTASVPVILLTARDHPSDISDGLQSGADWYMTKPFRQGEVAALVQRFHRAASDPVPAAGERKPLPLVEIDLFTMTTADSFDLAVRGSVIAGLSCLEAGLHRAAAARAAGEPWAAELVRRYEEVRDHYIARHGPGLADPDPSPRLIANGPAVD
jgi:CheY-like chemotaxis protein